MTLAEFLIFLMAPIGGLAIGCWALWLSKRETRRFDEKREHAH